VAQINLVDHQSSLTPAIVQAQNPSGGQTKLEGRIMPALQTNSAGPINLRTRMILQRQIRGLALAVLINSKTQIIPSAQISVPTRTISVGPINLTNEIRLHPHRRVPRKVSLVGLINSQAPSAPLIRIGPIIQIVPRHASHSVRIAINNLDLIVS
jgi:hypothetical protein